MINCKNIAVIIPCFNEEEALLSCVDSVLVQSVLPQEIIIIDDGSSNPTTLEILKEIEKKNLVTIIYLKENKGPGIARNSGIESCLSSWIVLLDSDDVLLEGAIETLVSKINEPSNADFFFWNYCLNDSTSNSKSIISTKELCKNHSAELDPFKLARNFIMPGCSPFKRELWSSIGGYDPQLSKGGVEDIDFWRRAVLKGGIGFHIDKTMYQWNRASTGNNSNIDEFKYLIHRQKILPYYDEYNPEHAKEIRPYIYRYYSSRLMAKELNDFLKKEKNHFSPWDRCKAKLLYITPLHKIVRKISDFFLFKNNAPNKQKKSKEDEK